MASDVNKHFEKARRLLEKNKLREAATEYQAVLDEAPSNQEAIQVLFAAIEAVEQMLAA